MPTVSRTFRIFVSSTFSDLKAERNALQKYVFPRLRDLAMAHGCRFHAIDLRWGVSEEAALDQQTMKICLTEIERCQKTSPRPNFIILLGDRYGWRPLPYEVPADEFEQIVPLVSLEEKALLEQWYRRDDNSIPAVYCLLARSGEFGEYSAWEQVENILRQAFLGAIVKLNLSPDTALKYTASATEQEIVAGALQVEDAHEHVFGYFRRIEGLAKNGRSKEYLDSSADATQKLTELKERLRNQIPGNIHVYQATWQGEGPSLDHLDRLCEDVYADLSKIILAEFAHLEVADPLEREIAAHTDFGKDRARIFIGRTDILKSIFDSLREQNSHPLAIWGVSGSGKSALIAKAVDQAQENSQKVIFRFIGATPESSNGQMLLESLCKQISRHYGAGELTIPTEYKYLVKEFQSRLSLATPDKPLFIFLDALDQLSDTDNARSLTWLPVELPPNVCLVVSTLPGDCLKVLKDKLRKQNLLEIHPMSVEEGKAILSAWLYEANRKLQKTQEQYLLSKFMNCGLPLYLRLAFEEGRLWKSYHPFPELSDGISGMVRDLFKRLSQESNHGKVIVSRSLGYLAAGKNGLSEDELLDVLSTDDEVLADFHCRSPKSPKVERLPVVIWSRLYFDLQPYLVERAADGISLLAFYHRQVGEAVNREYLPYGEKQKRHQNLARYFSEKPYQIGSGDEARPNLRRLSEQPFQEAYAGFSDQFVNTLSDFEFLEAKNSAIGVQQLIDDYHLVNRILLDVDTKKGLLQIRDALRLSMSFLAQDPNLLPSHLLGRLYASQDSLIQALLQKVILWDKKAWLRPSRGCLSPPGGSLLTTLQGHTGRVYKVAVTPDGKRAISASSNHTLKVWDLDNYTELATLEGLCYGAVDT